MSDPDVPEADVFVIFGITGDLAHKMTFPALYQLEANGLLDCPIVGVASEDWTTEHLVAAIREALSAAGVTVADKVFDRLAGRLTYLHGDFTDLVIYQQVADRLKGSSAPLFYLEIPPSLFAPVVSQLGKADLTARARVDVDEADDADRLLQGASVRRWALEGRKGPLTCCGYYPP